MWTNSSCEVVSKMMKRVWLEAELCQIVQRVNVREVALVTTVLWIPGWLSVVVNEVVTLCLSVGRLRVYAVGYHVAASIHSKHSRWAAVIQELAEP